MKILLSSRTCVICLFLLLLHSGCKKEDFTKDIVGSYTATARETVYSTAAGVPSTVSDYPNCNIRIEKINRENIRIIITQDKANPGITRELNLEFEVQNRFGHHNPESRGIRSYDFLAKLENDVLDYTEYRSIFSEFIFKGHRD